jgi:hypothetical protein
MNIHSELVRFNDKSRFGAQAMLKRQTAAEIRRHGLASEPRSSFVPADGGDGRAVQPPVYMEAMMTRVSKAIVAGLASLAMAATIVLPTNPASAGGFRAGGGFHGGGWHGGGWGGGWHGGGWGAVACGILAIGGAVTGTAVGGPPRSPQAC